MNPTALAVGTFDGVHRGHKAVIEEVRRQAVDKDLAPRVITFDRHPLSLIDPSRVPPALTTLEQKEKLLQKAGVDPIFIPFDRTLRETTAEQWMERLADEWNVKILVVGYDTTFGCDGLELALADYIELGRKYGILVVKAPQVPGISSSAIRKAVAAGELENAELMLGYPFSLSGHVVTGNQLGRTIGFPTANLSIQPGLAVPGHNVYVATATLPDGNSRRAVVNIGVRPTVRRGNNPTIEAHIIDWQGSLYGFPLKLTFHKMLRPEIRFNSIDALRTQIEKDVTQAQLFVPSLSKDGK